MDTNRDKPRCRMALRKLDNSFCPLDKSFVQCLSSLSKVVKKCRNHLSGRGLIFGTILSNRVTQSTFEDHLELSKHAARVARKLAPREHGTNPQDRRSACDLRDSSQCRRRTQRPTSQADPAWLGCCSAGREREETLGTTSLLSPTSTRSSHQRR